MTNLYMDIYMYVYRHMYTSRDIHMYVKRSIYAETCLAWIYRHVLVLVHCAYIDMYTCIHGRVHVSVDVCVTSTDAYAYIQACVYIHIYAHVS